jgi:glycosyltransferase involved in cell wall biosynthesis
MRHVVVMVTTSYPRFYGDNVGSFIEPIAKHIAARGHEVHVVAPWHPAIARGRADDGVSLHFFKYAPVPALNVFGYAEGLRADVKVRSAAWLAAPLALTAGWFKAMRVAQKRGATVMHGHWAVPGGAIAAAACPSLPLVVSLHGSDVFVAERSNVARIVTRHVFEGAGAITACSQDLADRAVALGARPDSVEVVPYGVDTSRFKPTNAIVRTELRSGAGIPLDAPVVAAAGRFVSKKGFEYLIDALPLVTPSTTHLVIAGSGDLERALRTRARANAIADRVHFAGMLSQDAVGAWFAAADIVAVPSVRDDSGNVDGLPNTLLEGMASGTPVVATTAGGIGSVIEHDRSGLLVAERDARALAEAIGALLRDPNRSARIGREGRALVGTRFGWEGAAARFEAAYDRALAFK